MKSLEARLRGDRWAVQHTHTEIGMKKSAEKIESEVLMLAERLRPGIEPRPEQEPLFRDFCRCLLRLENLEARISREGIVVKDRKSGRRKHPALQTLREYRTACQRYMSLFGLERKPETKPEPRPGSDLLDGNWTPDLPKGVH